VYGGTPYAHPVLGTLQGIESITLDDVKAFYRRASTRGALRVGISGDVSEAMPASLKTAPARLPAGAGLAATTVPQGRRAASRMAWKSGSSRRNRAPPRSRPACPWR
jgi:zinc protease